MMDRRALEAAIRARQVPRPDLTPATGRTVLLRGDALVLPLQDASVDLIVTSPPYFGLRSYQDNGEHFTGQIGGEPTPAQYVDALIAATQEMLRVLKPTGSIWINLGDKYAGGGGGPHGRDLKGRSVNQSFYAHKDMGYGRRAERRGGVREKSLIGIPWRYALRCIDDLGLILRAEVIWSKPHGMPESVTDRVRRLHETWFHFTRSGRYYGASTAVDSTGKSPGSVWTIAVQPLRVPVELGIEHFAAFPMEWPRRIIGGWAPPGGVILDPFGGTGTTAMVAEALDRTGISVDMSADYCRLATWRTNDPKQRAKADGNR